MKLHEYQMRCALEQRDTQQVIAVIGAALRVQLPPISSIKCYDIPDDEAQVVRIFAEGKVYKWIENRGFYEPGSYSTDINGGRSWASVYVNKKS